MDTRVRLAVVLVGAAAAFHLLPLAFAPSVNRQQEIEKRNKEIADSINKRD